MTGLAINTCPALTIGNLLLVGGIMAAGTSKGAAGRHPADMLNRTITVVAIDTGQGRSKVKLDVIMLSGVWVNRVNRAVTELTVARAAAGATLQDASDGGVTVGASTLMDITNQVGAGVTACCAGWCGAKGGV